MDHPQCLILTAWGRGMPRLELFSQFGKNTSILKEWADKLRAIRVEQRLQPLNKQMKEGIRDKGGVLNQERVAQFSGKGAETGLFGDKYTWHQKQSATGVTRLRYFLHSRPPSAPSSTIAAVPVGCFGFSQSKFNCFGHFISNPSQFSSYSRTSSKFLRGKSCRQKQLPVNKLNVRWGRNSSFEI